MSYLPHLSVESEVDLPQFLAQLEKLLSELRHTRAGKMQISEAGRRKLILIAQTMDDCAKEIYPLTRSRNSRLRTGADQAMSEGHRSW